jgi:alpha,alpha-trehalase
MHDWTWSYEGFDPDNEGLREALCAVGNGYVATRGAAPERAADDVHYPGTYGAGVFDRLASEISGETIENESMVNLPNWLPLTFRIDGGAWLDLSRVELLDYHQELDLRRAVLSRRYRFRDADGRTTSVSERRFVAMHLAHVCALETTIRAEDWAGRVDIRAAIDGTVQNTLVRRYRELAGNHLEPLGTAPVGDDGILLEVQTRQSHIRVAVAARISACRDDGPVVVRRRLTRRRGWIGQDLALSLERGQAITAEKVVTIFTSRDPATTEPAEEAARWLPRLGSFGRLLRGHVTAWSHLWDRFDFDLDREDGETRRILRLHLVHLLQTVSPNSRDLDVGVPARGLHGEAYRGHILWDEAIILPVLSLRLPELTRSLLMYRYRRLPEAREAALAAGFAGAMYPWQSGSDGREESQQLHLNPMSGRWLPDPTDRQRHVGSAIAYSVWHYYQSTGDREFLAHHGAELLLEIARFWASIAAYDRSRDRYVIRGVIGPDEFHTGYPDASQPGIDNNAYTNVMAVWVLMRALETLELLPEPTRTELHDRLRLHPDELDRWDEISRKMFVPFHDGGIISQFEGYEDLEELDWSGYRERYGDIQRLDRILEAEGDTVDRYQASKQADVLMLFYLLSAEELREILGRLGYELGPEQFARTVEYYLERTSHGSTLSAMVHAWVLARSHRERALELFFRALRADVADVQGGTTAEGIHLAAMAGSVDLLQRCFSGLELRHDRLILNPYWPEELGNLRFTILYREQRLSIRISGTDVEVAADAGRHEPIKVVCRDEMVELKPGSRVEFSGTPERIAVAAAGRRRRAPSGT